MKKIFAFAAIVLMASCKPAMYVGNYGQINQTQVVLTGPNFKVLGSFKGIATEKNMKLSIKEQEGLITRAKENMLLNAKMSGVDLKGGPRALVNVCVDVIQNEKRVTATFSAEIIEFTN